MSFFPDSVASLIIFIELEVQNMSLNISLFQPTMFVNNKLQEALSFGRLEKWPHNTHHENKLQI